jgi:hypothetical protein
VHVGTLGRRDDAVLPSSHSDGVQVVQMCAYRLRTIQLEFCRDAEQLIDLGRGHQPVFKDTVENAEVGIQLGLRRCGSR